MPSAHTKVRVKRESCLQSERILSLDSFATSQNFNFQNGSATYRTASGACLNVSILLITLIFTIQQCILLFGYDKTSFTTSVITDFFDETHSYTQQDQDFMIAFAIMDLKTYSSTDSTGRPIDTMLELELKQQSLEIGEDGQYELQFQSFDMRQCSENDLAKFFPLKPSQASWDELIRPYLQCVDMDNFEIRGNAQSVTFSRPMVNLKIPEVECRNDPYDRDCVTTREFDQLLEDKILFTLTNRKRFDQQSYTDSPIVEESLYKLHSVPPRQQVRSYEVHEGELVREDGLFMHIDNLTTKESVFFDVVEGSQAARVLPNSDPLIRLQLVYGLNTDQTVIDRNVYNVFMLLGDVGGFSGLLFSLGAAVMGLINFQNSENFLVQRLFHDGRAKKASTTLDPKKQLAFKEYLQSLLPAFCIRSGCLKLSRRDRNFQRARDLLTDEMDLIKLMRRVRFFNAAMKLLLTEEKTKEIQDSVKSLPIKKDSKPEGEAEPDRRLKPVTEGSQNNVNDFSAMREAVQDNSLSNVGTHSQMVVVKQKSRNRPNHVVLSQLNAERNDQGSIGFANGYSNSALDQTDCNESYTISDIR